MTYPPLITPREQTAEPMAPPEPAVAPAPEAAPDEVSTGAIPEELIRIPAMQALMAGEPPAVSGTFKEFKASAEMGLLLENKENLIAAGFGFYRALSGDTGVIFNSLHINPADLQAADKQGKLNQIAPPFNEVNHAVGKSGAANPALREGGIPAGAKGATAVAPPQLGPTLTPPQLLRAGGMPGQGAIAQPSVSPATAAVQRQIMGQRMAGLTPGAPTSGAKPGAGRLLNQILRPSV